MGMPVLVSLHARWDRLQTHQTSILNGFRTVLLELHSQCTCSSVTWVSFILPGRFYTSTLSYIRSWTSMGLLEHKSRVLSPFQRLGKCQSVQLLKRLRIGELSEAGS